MKRLRKIIQIDEEKCDGCGQCVLACAEGSLAIVDGKARVLSENLCDGLGACLGECPNDALRIVEREAEEFDHEAVERHLADHPAPAPAPAAAPFPQAAGGCPSARMETFAKPADDACQEANRPSVHGPDAASELTHWPVQIRLVPPTAPFLKGADLLVVADCVPIAFPSLHQKFLKGKVVMIGCPKFDNATMYVEKFTDIFTNAGPRRVTTVMMEVPCCAGLKAIVRKALQAAGRDIPLEEVVISTRGAIVSHCTNGSDLKN